MSSEANLPEVSVPQGPPPPADAGGDGAQGAPGTAASKSRRRRRKRKKTGPGESAAPNGGGETLSASGETAPAPVSAAPSNGGQSNGQQPRQFQNSGQSTNGQGNGQGKRWKKKFRRAGEGSGSGENRPPRPEPGNSLYGNSQGGRRNRPKQQRGPRTFVGPMDHSYRESNGNYSDSPPSTIEIHGNVRRNGGGGHQRQFNEDRMPPELMTNFRPTAIPEDAPTHIYFFVEDLFVTAKINEASKNQGVKVAFVKSDKDIVAQLADMEEKDHPSLIVFDLNNTAAKPLTLIPKLKAKLKKGTSIIGFLSHLQGDLKAKAVEAGCNTVMPRSAFSQSLPNLLRRYGVEEEEEQNFNY
jgi:hypothetical protein